MYTQVSESISQNGHAAAQPIATSKQEPASRSAGERETDSAALAARRRGRKQDVLFGPGSELGKSCWDTFMTLLATAAKLGGELLPLPQRPVE